MNKKDFTLDEVFLPDRTGRRKSAFTLAEVLITLGIIGVVAALTIPSLIDKHQKQVAVTQLKESYAVISQAIQMSEIGNGMIEDWSMPGTSLGNIAYNEGKIFFYKYLKSYLKSFKECSYNTTECVSQADINSNSSLRYLYSFVLNNGTVIYLWTRGSFSEVVIDINGIKGPNKDGKDRFYTLISKSYLYAPFGKSSKSGYYMYGQGYDNYYLKNANHYGCSKD